MSQKEKLSPKLSTSQLDAAFLFAHRANSERYKKILGTYLTDEEQAFVRRRLAEEQAAIERLTGTVATEKCNRAA